MQVGGAMTDEMAARARKEMTTNKRYQWLGEQPRARGRRILEKSCLCVLSSRIEGGANVLSEAIVASVPILASRIDGNVGIDRRISSRKPRHAKQRKGMNRNQAFRLGKGRDGPSTSWDRPMDDHLLESFR